MSSFRFPVNCEGANKSAFRQAHTKLLKTKLPKIDSEILFLKTMMERELTIKTNHKCQTEHTNLRMNLAVPSNTYLIPWNEVSLVKDATFSFRAICLCVQ